MRAQGPRQTPRAPGEPDLSAVAEALADYWTVVYGHRPARATAALAGDVLVVVLEGGLAPADELLVAAGAPEDAAAFRECFLASVRHEVSGLIEAIVDRQVEAYVPACDAASGVTTCTFVLAPSGDLRPASRDGAASARRGPCGRSPAGPP